MGEICFGVYESSPLTKTFTFLYSVLENRLHRLFILVTKKKKIKKGLTSYLKKQRQPAEEAYPELHGAQSGTNPGKQD